MKIIIVLVLLFSATSMLRAQYLMTVNSFEFSSPGFDYYKPFTEQSNMSNLYLLSDVTLKDNLVLYNPPGPGSDDWLDLPYGEIENALKMPVGCGLGILTMIVLGYAVRISLKRQSNM